MTDEIRRALEARIAATAGSSARQARIRARIAELDDKEEPIVKRKFSVAMALVLALMLLLGSTALAAGLGLNLFEFFGESEARWRNVADKAVLETQEPVTIHDAILGETVALLTNAYYDGQSLDFAYTLENWKYMEPWTPTEEEKASFGEPYGSASYLELLMEQGHIEPAPNGEPYGAIMYQIYPDDHVTANGIEVVPYEIVGGEQENGSYYEIVQCEVPLPEGVADQEMLELNVPLHQNLQFFWFDGSQWYMDSQSIRNVGAMTATVKKDEGVVTKCYSGAGEVNGVPVTVTAETTGVAGTVTVTAQKDMFFYGYREDRLHAWLIDLIDEKGRYLAEESIQWQFAPDELGYVTEGTGEFPESLTLLLYEYEYDGPTSLEEARAQGTIITLMPE